MHLIQPLILLVALLPMLCRSADWPGFRGATGDGISEERDLPVTWSAEKGIAWQTQLTGRGNSSPVVSRGLVYLTSQRSDESLWLHAFDENSGLLRWEKKVATGELSATGNQGVYSRDHDAASPTVAANDSRVCVLFGTADLACYTTTGETVWARNLNDDYGRLDINFGIAFSPRLWANTLYLSCLSKGPSYIIAIDLETGNNKWKTDRDYQAYIDGNDAYSTPAIWLPGPSLLVSGTDRLAAYDLLSGKEIWVASGFKIDAKIGRIITSPAASPDGYVVQCSGNPQKTGRAIAFKIDSNTRGDITESHRLWTVEKRSPDRATPICINGRAYFARDPASAFCIELESGKKLWETRLAGGKHYAGLVAGDGKIYIHNARGITTVIEEGSEWKKIAENQLPGSQTYHATPAIANGRIYFRNYESLIAVDGH